MENGNRLYTSVEAATACNLSVPRVKQLAINLHVGRKVGRDWVFTAEDIEALRNRPDRRRKDVSAPKEDL